MTVTTLFAGAGGDAQGAEQVPGVRIQLAANHSPLAMRSHAANFPHAEHDVADISQVDPRRYRRSTILWASPECTKQTKARGVRRDDHPQLDLFRERVRDDVVDRSRATMFDVHRFAEYHRYEAIVVENVADVAEWDMWRSWRLGFDDLGYDHEVLSLNSMHFPGPGSGRAPQSRDRLYVVAWRKGARRPQLDLRPAAWCPECDVEVRAVHAWKRPRPGAVGWYRQQYLYRCPNAECRNRPVEPYTAPAAAAIDWSIPGQRIGDRRHPFVENTMRRIRIGLQRYGGDPVLVPYYGTGVAHPTTEPMRTIPTRDRFRLAFIAEMRGGNSTARSVHRPLSTIATSGNHHRLVEPPRSAAEVEDCVTRMLTVAELQAGMGFRPSYTVLGTDEERKLQIGNAVTPCAAEHLVGAVVDSLAGAA